MPSTTVMAYLKQELSTGAGFVKEFMALSQKDKDELKQYAREELKVLNITVTG